MGMLKLDAVVHWSIPVNNLEGLREVLRQKYSDSNMQGRLAYLLRTSVLPSAAITSYSANAKSPWSEPSSQDGRFAPCLRRKPGDVQ